MCNVYKAEVGVNLGVDINNTHSESARARRRCATYVTHVTYVTYEMGLDEMR